MKTYKFLPAVALVSCYVFGSAAAAAEYQVCLANGACTNRPIPASSLSTARSVDIMVRPPTRNLAPELGLLTGAVTTGVRYANDGSILTTYFCVAGQGVELGVVNSSTSPDPSDFASSLGRVAACPASSGAIVLGRAMVAGRGDGQEQ